MLSNIVAELIAERVVTAQMRTDQKFCFGVQVYAPDSEQRPDELDVEISPSGTRDAAGSLQYSIKVNDDTLPINVTGVGIRAVLHSLFVQIPIVDFTSHSPWWTIKPKQRVDYRSPSSRPTPMMFRIGEFRD